MLKVLLQYFETNDIQSLFSQVYACTASVNTVDMINLLLLRLRTLFNNDYIIKIKIKLLDNTKKSITLNSPYASFPSDYKNKVALETKLRIVYINNSTRPTRSVYFLPIVEFIIVAGKVYKNLS